MYYLEYCRKERVNTSSTESKEWLWHRRYERLGEQSLQSLARTNITEQFDYDVKKGIGFCETCVKGKQHRNSFDSSKRHSAEPLELVHSDFCGKMREKSQGGAVYFLTFVDDHSHYTWVYLSSSKDRKFKEWKVLVVKSSGKKLKTLRSDNGGEFTLTQFKEYLKQEGILH